MPTVKPKPAATPHETAYLRDYLRAGDAVVDLAAALAEIEEPRAFTGRDVRRMAAVRKVLARAVREIRNITERGQQPC